MSSSLWLELPYHPHMLQLWHVNTSSNIKVDRLSWASAAVLILQPDGLLCWSFWLSHGASLPPPAVWSIAASLLSLCFHDSLVLTSAMIPDFSLIKNKSHPNCIDSFLLISFVERLPFVFPSSPIQLRHVEEWAGSPHSAGIKCHFVVFNKWLW